MYRITKDKLSLFKTFCATAMRNSTLKTRAVAIRTPFAAGVPVSQLLKFGSKPVAGCPGNKYAVPQPPRSSEGIHPVGLRREFLLEHFSPYLHQWCEQTGSSPAPLGPAVESSRPVLVFPRNRGIVPVIFGKDDLRCKHGGMSLMRLAVLRGWRLYSVAILNPNQPRPPRC
jgi:hypothetical protein